MGANYERAEKPLPGERRVDPTNPNDRSGWNVQLNAPSGVDPGEVTLYAVCAKVK